MQTYGCSRRLAPPRPSRSAKIQERALVETVGYGIQSVQPHPLEVDARYKSTSRIVEINGNASKGGNLHTLNNPSDTGGRGGSCFGDSGGPVFVNNTNQVIAVVSWGNSETCHGADYSWRVDNVDATSSSVRSSGADRRPHQRRRIPVGSGVSLRPNRSRGVGWCLALAR